MAAVAPQPLRRRLVYMIGRQWARILMHVQRSEADLAQETVAVQEPKGTHKVNLLDDRNDRRVQTQTIALAT